MKTLLTFLLLVLAANIADAQWAQPNDPTTIQINPRSFGRPHEENPTVFFKVTSHDPMFRAFPARSFYKSRQDWRRIIDSTWGPGLPTASKLQLFDTYAGRLQNQFDGFLSRGLTPASWDSLRGAYRNKITDSTSRGGFAAIMGYFAGALQDGHTYAEDNVVLNTPLNPGTPILVISGFGQVEHFGAVLTALPDSTLLVVRTVANHPLDLRPGDIILGYEGRPWKTLVRELMAAELPVVGVWSDAPSAFSDALLLGAGMNWHLFDTIDVLKWGPGSRLVVHLSVSPLITLPSTPMLNNEQLPIPGIPFPGYFNNQSVSYGIVPNTNIGYIYLFEENGTTTDNQFHQAYLALQGTDALIIDMRLNFGGWSLFPQSFAMMFNESITTIEDAYRCSPATFTLCPSGNSSIYVNPGQPPEQWEKPIAVLLGPTGGSMGDVTAQRLRYHDMVKFFGKSCVAALGDNISVTGFSGWSLHLSIGDMFHTATPGVYLNRREFPIDYPVWFTSAGVAEGHDGVVDEAMNWIQRVVYPHDVTTDRHWYRPNADTVFISAHYENPDTHQVRPRLYIELLSGAILDSVGLQYPNGQWGGFWPVPNLEATFKIRATTMDLTTGRSMTIRNAQRFFTSGPVEVVGHAFWPDDTIPNPGDQLPMRLYVRNQGLLDTLKNLSFNIVPLDTFITSQQINPSGITALPPGGVDSTWYSFLLTIRASTPGNTDHPLRVEAYSNAYPAWTDTMVLHVSPLVGVNEEPPGIPLVTRLEQNYPNPFNPVTRIKYQLSAQAHVTLKVYDVLGREVATLVNGIEDAGYHNVQWSTVNSQLSSGVYFYRLQAGSYVSARKLVLMK